MMRIFWIIICVALLGSAAVITMTSLSPSSSAPVTPQREIAASPVGQCVNLGGALEAPVEGSWGYIIRERDLHAIRAAARQAVGRHHSHTSGGPRVIARVCPRKPQCASHTLEK